MYPNGARSACGQRALSISPGSDRGLRDFRSAPIAKNSPSQSKCSLACSGVNDTTTGPSRGRLLQNAGDDYLIALTLAKTPMHSSGGIVTLTVSRHRPSHPLPR